MQATFYTETLKSILNQAKGFSTAKSSDLPVLANVMITAQDNGYVTFTTYDLTSYAKLDTNANVTKAGSILVNCSKILDVIKSGDGEITTLETVNGLGEHDTALVRVVCGSVSVNLNLDNAEWPEMPHAEEWDYVATFTGADLGSAIDKVITVISKDEVRPVLCGMHFMSTPKGIVIEGTDGYRMTRITLGKADTPFNFILPGNAAKGLLAMIAPDMPVQFYQKDSQLKIMVGYRAILYVVMTQGEYPKTDSIIIDTTQAASIKANRKEFIRQLQSVLKFKPNADIVSLKSVANGCELQASGVMGNITMTVPALVTGSMTTAYNVKFLLEIMKSMSGDTVELKVVDPMKPGVIQEPITTKALSIIMPVRVRE